MSEDFSVSATMSAKDQGFTSTLRAGMGALDSLTAKAAKSSSIFKSVLSANVIGSGISKGIGLVSSGIGGLMSDLNESSKAWQTFQGNMEQIQMPTDQINAAKKDMKQFAVQTIYSASDMASTYSQLAAVGIKNTGQLVKGFGGLAAASSEPTQAMKTLSQQATQMAAKPKVQWQDFKLMLEQTPAGISAVAKTMNRSTTQLVTDVQNGKVKTQDFFDAISKTGTNATFSKMATQFKTVGQAIDGLKEGLSNKLQPIFDKISQKGITFVSNLSDAINKIDFEKIANKAMTFLGNIKRGLAQLWAGFKDSGAISALGSAFSAIGRAINNIKSALSGGTGDAMKNLGMSLGGITSKAAGIIQSIANAIANMSPGQVNAVVDALKAVAVAMIAFKAGSAAFQKGLAVYNGVSKAVGAIGMLTSALKKLGGAQKSKGANPIADMPSAPATTGLSGWAGVAKSVGVILAIGASMKLIASAFKDMASVKISWGQLGNNLAQMGTFLVASAVSMGAIGGAIQLFPPIAAALAIGAGVFVGLAGTMTIVGKGLESFSKSSASAIKAVNDIKFDKNFAGKLVGILGAMTSLSAIGGFTGLLGTIAAPFAVLGSIGYSAIASTITKVAKFASDLSKMDIPTADGIKPKLKQIQEIATSLASFKIGSMGNIDVVINSAFAGLTTGNIIGTFQKVSDFIKQISAMPEIDASDLKTKFKALSDFRNTLNDAMQGSSTGGNSVDASFNSFFGKLDTGNIISSFQKVSDFVKKISTMDSIDDSDIDDKFASIKKFLTKMSDFASGQFDWSIFTSIASFFGKLDTGNLVSSFTKVADLATKIEKLPDISDKSLDGKFKSIKSVFNKLKDFKVDTPPDSLKTALDTIQKITGPLSEIAKKFQSLNGVVVNSTNVIATMSAIKSIIDFLPKLNFKMPKGLDTSINDLVKPIDSLTTISKSLQGLSGMVVNSVNVIATMNAIQSIIGSLTSTFTAPLPKNIGTNLKSLSEPVKSISSIAQTLQTLSGLVVNSVNVIATMTAIQSIIGALKSTFSTKMPDGIEKSLESIKGPISSLVSAAQSLQPLNGLVVNSTTAIATMNAIMTIVSDGAWLTIQSVISNWGSMQTDITKATTTIGSLTGMVNAMNGIPPVSAAIQANVDNIQKGLDKLSGINFSADIAGKAAQYASAVNSLLSSLKGLGGNFTPVGTEWASKITDGFVSGISSSTGKASAAVQSMISSVRSSAAASASQFQYVGAMIGQGLAEGMYGALGEVTAAADALVSQANRAAQAKAKIHSPSRLFRDEVGYYIGAGIAVGITKSTANVVSATELLTNKTLRAATSMLPKLQTISTNMMNAVTPDVSALSDFAANSKANFESKLNANYSYNQPIYVTAEVTSNMDGKKVGYGSAQYVKERNDTEDRLRRMRGGNY